MNKPAFLSKVNLCPPLPHIKVVSKEVYSAAVYSKVGFPSQVSEEFLVSYILHVPDLPFIFRPTPAHLTVCYSSVCLSHSPFILSLPRQRPQTEELKSYQGSQLCQVPSITLRRCCSFTSFSFFLKISFVSINLFLSSSLSLTFTPLPTQSISPFDLLLSRSHPCLSFLGLSTRHLNFSSFFCLI